MEDKLESSIEINDEGEIYILKTGRQYKVLAFIFVVLSLTGLVIQAMRIKRYGFKEYAEWQSTFSYTIIPVIFIIYLGFAAFQVSFYYKAIRIQNHAIYSFDKLLFNQSFRYYFLGNMMSIISMSIYIFVDLITLYIEVN